MDSEEYLKRNNPPRGDTFTLVCGKSFIDELEQLERKYATTES